ncbi:MAG TPA: hypothetical protein VKG44_05095, partial [Candidatus Baltobacteraceae bacterium]|nr:hypothetical protein [Candidatus Baltobacteraceae bacterium]
RLTLQNEDPALDALAARVALLEGGEKPQASAATPKAHAEAPKARVPAASAAAPAAAPATGAPAEPPAQAAPKGPVTLQRVRSQWDRIRQRAEEQHKPIKAPLSRATVDGLEGDRLIVGLVDGVNESIVREHSAVLEKAVADVLGTPLRVTLHAPGQSAGVRTSAHRAPRRGDSEAPESALEPDGEADLLAYAREKLGGTQPS